jgi:hypothetical protein
MKAVKLFFIDELKLINDDLSHKGLQIKVLDRDAQQFFSLNVCRDRDP